MRLGTPLTLAFALSFSFVSACGSSSDGAKPGSSSGTTSGGTNANGGSSGTAPGGTTQPPGTTPPPQVTPSPPANPPGNPDGKCDTSAAPLEDISSPTTVVGTGTVASCTSDATVAAIAKGGVVTFSCGPDPVTITLTETAKVMNNVVKTVIDGGGKVTLSGGKNIRILYMNACDKTLGGYPPAPPGKDCNTTTQPALTLQNISFDSGNSTAIPDTDNGAGGGAVWVRGGRFKAIKTRFTNNVCAPLGSDLGGAAIRILDFPPGGSVDRPMYIVDSTFDSNNCANGGAISSIGTSYTILNSVFTNNQAVGHGANDGQGGNGGAIYNDGNTYALDVCGSDLENNKANEGGSAIFYVSNDKTGTIAVTNSTLKNNPRGTFETMPGIYVIAKSPIDTTGSTISR